MNTLSIKQRCAKAVDGIAGNTGRNLVKQAEVLALSSMDKSLLKVAKIAQMLAVSEKTLRRAFNDTHGLSPCRHLRMLRMLQVRRELMLSHDQEATVTEIATRFGFAELGRFAVEYRKEFGESPSVTLRRAHLLPFEQPPHRTDYAVDNQIT